jgi:hypothetical protein
VCVCVCVCVRVRMLNLRLSQWLPVVCVCVCACLYVEPATQPVATRQVYGQRMDGLIVNVDDRTVFAKMY